MPQDHELLAQMEQLRGQIHGLKTQIAAVTADGMALGGMKGIWARLTGDYEQRVQDAEMTLAVLREELSIHQQALIAASERLAAARGLVDVPVEPAAEALPPAEPPHAPPMDEPSAELLQAARRVYAVERLLHAIEGLHKLTFAMDLAHASARPVRHGRYAPSVGSQLQRNKSQVMNSSHGWDNEASDAGMFARELGIELYLPRQRRLAQDAALGPHGGWEVSDDDEFLAGVRSCGSELDDAKRRARAIRTEVLQTHPEAAAVPRELCTRAGSSLNVGEGFVAMWRALLTVAERLERQGANGLLVREMLPDLTKWQQIANPLRTLATDEGLEPVPLLLHPGNDVHAFVAEVSAQRTGWEQTIGALEHEATAEAQRRQEAERADPAVQAAARERFASLWVELLGHADRLVAVVDAPLGQIVLPLQAWQQAAPEVRQLAQQFNLRPVPPLNEGEVRAFMAIVRDGVPDWRAELGLGPHE